MADTPSSPAEPRPSCGAQYRGLMGRATCTREQGHPPNFHQEAGAFSWLVSVQERSSANSSSGETPAPRLANESWLAAEIARMWGKHGAHAEVFGMLLTRAGIASEHARALPANVAPDPRDAEIARLDLSRRIERQRVEERDGQLRGFESECDRLRAEVERLQAVLDNMFGRRAAQKPAATPPAGDARG